MKHDRLLAQAEALSNFLKIFEDGYLADDIGPQLSCQEADTFCELFNAHDLDGAADSLMDSHCRADSDGDSNEHLSRRRELLLQDEAEVTGPPIPPRPANS